MKADVGAETSLSDRPLAVIRWEVREGKGDSEAGHWHPPLSVSTKGVHGVWITMWMSDQYHAVSEYPAHCPIGRQHNPCNFTEMQFFSKNSNGAKPQIPLDPEDSLRSSIQKCADWPGGDSPHYSWRFVAKLRSRVARQARGATKD
jgi:hypothetical protein